MHVAFCSAHQCCGTVSTMFPQGLRTLVLHTTGIPTQNWAPEALGVYVWFSSLTEMYTWISRTHFSKQGKMEVLRLLRNTPGSLGHASVHGEKLWFPCSVRCSYGISGMCLSKQIKLDSQPLPGPEAPDPSQELSRLCWVPLKPPALGCPCSCAIK